MGRFSVVLPIVDSLYQEEELIPVLSRCVAEWELFEVDEPRQKFLIQ